MPNDKELGLETLLAVRAELEADLDIDLINACFEIQKKYQFSHDRVLSTNAMDRIIEEHVEKAAKAQDENEE